MSGTVSSLAIVAGCDSPPPALSISNCVGRCTLSSAVQHFEGLQLRVSALRGPQQVEQTCLRATLHSHQHGEALSEQRSVS